MIDIYKTWVSDIDEMKFNKWAWCLKSKKAIKQLKQYISMDQVYSFTLWDTVKEHPVAVLSFHSYGEGLFLGQIVADELFEQNPKYAIKMKYLIGRVIEDYKVRYVQTVSEDAEQLNKWHEFLGFKKEKVLPNYRRGRTFIVWSM